jgi:methylated-DNA-[protein]-cysteine S-methyltransferase
MHERIEFVTVDPITLSLHWRDGRIAAMGLQWAGDMPASRGETDAAAALADALDSYLAGEDVQWPELPLDWDRLPPFQAAVLAALREKVRSGTCVTYGEMAEMAGRPRAARAVGRAMATNPWPIVFPCHRVVGASGKLVGFGGEGLPMKEYLLRLEGALPYQSAENL